MEYGPFREIADEIGATLMVDMAHIAGLVAVGLHPSPVPHADFVTSKPARTACARVPRQNRAMREMSASRSTVGLPEIQGRPAGNARSPRRPSLSSGAAPRSSKPCNPSDQRTRRWLKFSKANCVSSPAEPTPHLMLEVDVSVKASPAKAIEGIRGRRDYRRQNAIPFDQQKPFVTTAFASRPRDHVARTLIDGLRRSGADHQRRAGRDDQAGDVARLRVASTS